MTTAPYYTSRGPDRNAQQRKESWKSSQLSCCPRWHFSGLPSMMRSMPTKDCSTEPCRRCGKTPRADALGYCRDCADTLALRGLLVPLPAKYAGEAQAEVETEPAPEE